MSFEDVVLKDFRKRIKLETLYTYDYRLNLYIEEVDKIIKKIYDKILFTKCSRFFSRYTWQLSNNVKVDVMISRGYRIFFSFKKEKRKFCIDYNLSSISNYEIEEIIKEIKNYENIEEC